MDLEKTQHGNTQPSEESPRRKQAFSLSLSFRSAGKRASVMGIDTPEPHPTCQERSHYPVFNPRDSRHNPTLSPSPSRRHDSRDSSADAPKQAHWVQDLPRRSLHKARSGLLALRAGLLRRSTRQDSDLDDTGPELLQALGPPQRNQGLPGYSDASTQEDLTFGIGLYRTRTPWPSASTDASSEGLARVGSPHTLTNVASTPGVRVSCDALHGPESRLVYPVNVASDEPPAYGAIFDRDEDHRTFESLDTDTDHENLGLDGTGDNTDGHLNEDWDHSDTSSDWETIASSGKCCRLTNQDIIGTHEQCNTDNALAEQQEQTSGAILGDSTDTEFFGGHISRPEMTSSGTSDESPLHEQQIAGSTGSFKLPDPDAPSISDPNTARQRFFNIRDSEALVTQERLQLRPELPSTETDASLVPVSRNCSANVKFAFPGIYQELLEQWRREPHDNPVNNVETERDLRATRVPALPASSQETSETQPSDNEPPWYCRERTHMEATDMSGSQAMENPSSMLSSGQHGLRSSEDIWMDHARSSRFTAADSARDPADMAHAHPVTNAPATNARHSFGLHMSLRNDTGERSIPNAPSQQDIPRQSFDQQDPAENRCSLSSLGTCDMISSLFDEAEFSSNYIRDSVTSPGPSSRISMSNSAWSPIESPVDEEVLFPNIWRDEYYMVDGKTSGYYPDRGDQPVKATWRRVVDDGSFHRGPGLDRTPSSRVHVSELMTPMTFPRASEPNTRPRREREGSEPTEDYISRYRTQARHLR